MALHKFSLLFSLVLSSILLVNCPVKCECDKECCCAVEDNLYQEINKFRASLNLRSLTKNKIAECVAGKIAKEFRTLPCINTAVPVIPNLLFALSMCNVPNIATRDELTEMPIMPACVPDLVPSLVLTNFTKSSYSGYLNDTKYTRIGIGSQDDWIIVVLSTNTFFTSNGVNLVSKLGLFYCSVLLLVGNILLY